MHLEGLPDVKRKVTNFTNQRSVSGLISKCTRKLATSAASDNGCIVVYIDDKGRYHGDRSAFGTTRDEVITTRKTELRAFLKKNLPLIN